jgi:hypothetical protein
MTRFSIWSLTPRPWRPPIAFTLSTASAREVNFVSFAATGMPRSKWRRTRSGSTFTSDRHEATPMIGSTIDTPTSRRSRSFASWVAPSMLLSVL